MVKLLNIGLTILTALDLKQGTGKHTWDIPASTTTPHFKLQYATGILYYIALPVTKLAICLTYKRIVDVNRTSKLLIRALIIYLCVTGVGLTIFIMNECTPINAYWNDQFGPQCWKRRSVSNTIFFVNASSNTFTDICIIAIVLPVIWKLQMAQRQKLLLYGIVCIGWFAVASSIIRMVVVSRVLKSTDPAWEAADMDIWSCVECNTSLICAAAPCTRPFINMIGPHLLPSYIRRVTNRTTGNIYTYGDQTTKQTRKQSKSEYAMSDVALTQNEEEPQIYTHETRNQASRGSGKEVLEHISGV